MSLAVNSVGEPDAANPHVRFDERGWETARLVAATAPILDSTCAQDDSVEGFFRSLFKARRYEDQRCGPKPGYTW